MRLPSAGAGPVALKVAVTVRSSPDGIGIASSRSTPSKASGPLSS